MLASAQFMVKNKIRKSLFEQGQSISNESKNKLGLQIQKHALEIIDTRDIEKLIEKIESVL